MVENMENIIKNMKINLKEAKDSEEEKDLNDREIGEVDWQIDVLEAYQKCIDKISELKSAEKLLSDTSTIDEEVSNIATAIKEYEKGSETDKKVLKERAFQLVKLLKNKLERF